MAGLRTVANDRLIDGAKIDNLPSANLTGQSLKVVRVNVGETQREYANLVGGGDVLGPTSSDTNTIVLFDGITGKLIKQASNTGVIKATAGVIGTAIAGTDYSDGTSSLATGIVKSTTGTGALTIAVAGDFPTLNQNTTGNADTATEATTAINIDGGVGGEIPYQSGAGATALLANGTAGQVLQSNGTTLAPSWVAPSTGGYTTVTAKTSGVVYQAGASGGFLTVSALQSVTGSGVRVILSDVVNPPTTQVATFQLHEVGEGASMSAPILPNEYYKVTGAAETILFYE